MKQKFMWLLFKMGLSLFSSDYMSQGREIEAYRTKSVCKNPYNTRYLLVL